jgi:hypothetical protein
MGGVLWACIIALVGVRQNSLRRSCSIAPAGRERAELLSNDDHIASGN